MMMMIYSVWLKVSNKHDGSEIHIEGNNKQNYFF